MTNRTAMLAVTSVIAAATLDTTTAWSATPFQDALVQAPTLTAPQRGSLAGTLSRTAFGPGDLGRGAFTLALPIDAPTERGPLLADVIPRYSADTGTSEWGVGWQLDLSIRRFRPSGELDFATDDFTSPWGRLAPGLDGYYPSGLASVVRVTAHAGGWIAVTGDGTRFTFDAADAVTTSRGVYEWMLSRVDNIFGDTTRLHWVRNASGRPFLADVQWGGRGDGTQYQMTFEREPVAIPFVSYASGERRLVDQRVTRVIVGVKQSAGYATRWSYGLAYQASPTGPAFYLQRVTKTFASGESDPPVLYDYDLGTEQLATATLAPVTALDGFLSAQGGLMIQPDHSTITDLEQDGLADLETGFDQTTVRQTATGYVIEALPPAPDANSLCRPGPSLFNKPRQLARMHPDAAEPHVVFTHKNPTGGTTHVLLCDRAGVARYDENLAGAWALDANTRLVDVDQDRRPDLVRVARGQIQVLRNTSTGPDSLGFAAAPTQVALSPLIPPVASWILDFNGDGRPDLMVRHTVGVQVWLGTCGGMFEPTGTSYGFKTASGSPLPNFANYQFSHGDFNGDGLSDVILTQGRTVLVFTNRGNALVLTPVPGLANIPWTFGYPVVADLSGGGNEEAVFLQGDRAMAIELTTPSTGLMRSADDGKGTVLRFGYGRARPSAGIMRRPSTLTALTVESSGYDAVTYRYDYDAPVMHSVGKHLVGFGRITKRSPILTEQLTLLHDDDISGVLAASDDTDDRSPGIVRFTRNDYQDVTFHGVRWLRPASVVTGYRNSDGSVALSTSTQYAAYERQRCATVIVASTPSGQLMTTSALASMAGIPDDLHCDARTENLFGTHPDASLDFHYLVELTRNALGQVTRITQFDETMHPLVLQDIGYDADHRVTSIAVPGRGTTSPSYDAEGRLLSVTDPLGVVMQVTAFDQVSDALLWLETSRSDVSITAMFQHDGRERLQSTWDDFSGTSPTQPLSSYIYQDATNTAPGRIDTRSLADAVSGAARQAVELVGADGEPLVIGSWLGNHFSFGSSSIPSLATLTRRSSFVGTMSGEALSALTSNDLRALGTPLDETVMAGFGHSVRSTTTQQLNVTGVVTSALVLDGAELLTRTREPGGFTAESTIDAAGKLVRKIDENGVIHRYVYDALGRLVHVETPDGGHRLVFDGIGRPSSVIRDGIGTVTYSYDPVTGMPTHKQHLDATGAVTNTSVTTYDGAGRPLQVFQTAVDDTSNLVFDYDGQLDGTVAQGQLGRLTRVRGEGWERSSLFDPLGRDYEDHIRLTGWRDLTRDKLYRTDGSVASNTLTIRDTTGTVRFHSTQETVLDELGRVITLKVDGEVLYTLAYDDEGRLARADFASGEVLTFDYDPVTHERSGHHVEGPDSTGGVRWELDPRGLVAAEIYGNGMATTRRAYSYDGRGALRSSTSGADNASYAYTASGLPDTIHDVAGSRSVHRTSRSLVIGDTPYTWDAAGRLVAKGAWIFRYGANGQLSHANRPGRQVDFTYDEGGNRLLKRVDGVPVRANVAGGVLTEDHFIELITVGGVVAGVLDNGQFTALLTDPRGTPFAGPDGTPSFATPYGVRSTHLGFAETIDYARLGWDPDLDVIRMGVRDYDATLSQFLTPDPLFFEDLERCQQSPLQCTLYGYASGNPISFVDPTGQDNEAVLRPVFRPETMAAFAEGAAIARFLVTKGGAYGVIGASIIMVGYAYYEYSLSTPNPFPVGRRDFGPSIIESYTWGARQEKIYAAAHEANVKAAQDFKALASSIKEKAEKAAANAKSNTAAPSGGMDPRNRVQPPPEQRKSGPVYKTNTEAAEAAEKLGFKRVSGKANGQAVYSDGKTYISRDVDGHNGGAWKMARSVRELGQKSTRLGTYDVNLNRVGD